MSECGDPYKNLFYLGKWVPAFAGATLRRTLRLYYRLQPPDAANAKGQWPRLAKSYRKTSPHKTPAINSIAEITIAASEPFAALISNSSVAISRYTSLT